MRVADDLVERASKPAAPNVFWVADITYLRSREGWVYLAAVEDAYSRRIMGWSMAEHMRAELVVDALQMALARRRPRAGLIHHSDQGSQFVSLAFGLAARDAGIAISMGSRGDAYDNAVAVSFFATLKKELVRRRSWPSRPTPLQSAARKRVCKSTAKFVLLSLSDLDIAGFFELRWGSVAERGVPSDRVLEGFDVFEDLADELAVLMLGGVVATEILGYSHAVLTR